MAVFTIVLPRPLRHQRPILAAPIRFKIIAAGRRFGKTVTALVACVVGHGPLDSEGKPKFRGAIDGAHVWWVARNFPQSEIVWRSLKDSLRGAWTLKDEVEKRIELPGGGSITVKSADRPESLVGPGLDGVVLDEAARYRNDLVWAEAIRSTLLETGGWAIFISSPRGLNWFWEMYEGVPDYFVDPVGWWRDPANATVVEGVVDGEWARWKAPSYANPKVPPKAIESIRNDPRVSALQFAQEIEAEFVSTGTGIFDLRELRRYRAHVTETGEVLYVLGRDAGLDVVPGGRLSLFQTVDLATSEKTSADFSVVSTWGRTPTYDLLLLDVDRERRPQPRQVPAIRENFERWTPAWVGIESKGYQLATVQEARAAGLPIRELLAKGDKTERALSAVARMEAHMVFFPAKDVDSPRWLSEVELEMAGFPGGTHDDFVDTFAYAAIAVGRLKDVPVVAPTLIARESPWRID